MKEVIFAQFTKSGGKTVLSSEREFPTPRIPKTS